MYLESNGSNLPCHGGSVSRPSDGQNRKYCLSESLAPTLGALGESQARCAKENKAET
jgi:hypothetical protein